MKKRLSQKDIEAFSSDDSAVEEAFYRLLNKGTAKIKSGDKSAMNSLQWHAYLVLEKFFRLAGR